MVSIILSGGLGNQMFQFAAAKALALRLDTGLMLDLSFIDQHRKKSWSRPYELDIFSHSANIKKRKANLNRIFIYIIPSLNKKPIGRWILSLFKYYCENDNINFLSLTNGTTLFGYFTSEIFFKQYRDEILSEFTFKYPFNTYCQEKSNEIENCNSVSVHIRRGDYLNENNSNIYFHCSPEWYLEAIQLMSQKIGSSVFYFFSDDITWAQENFSFLTNSRFIDTNHGSNSFNDMRLMSLCKHNIIANSTFSWWGAWMNKNENKIVIAPKYYYKNSPKPNFTPENWVLL